MSDQSGMVNGANAQPTLSFIFTVAEWMAIREGLFELRGRVGLPIIQKLEALLMQAQNAQLTTEEARKGIVQ